MPARDASRGAQVAWENKEGERDGVPHPRVGWKQCLILGLGVEVAHFIPLLVVDYDSIMITMLHSFSPLRGTTNVIAALSDFPTVPRTNSRGRGIINYQSYTIFVVYIKAFLRKEIYEYFNDFLNYFKNKIFVVFCFRNRNI